jgi:hypothetical protein
MKNDIHIGVRAPKELRAAWNRTCEAANQDSAAIARELIAAAIRYHSRNDNLYPPFELVPAARAPEERITYTISAPNGVAIVGNNNGNVRVHSRDKRDDDPCELTVTVEREVADWLHVRALENDQSTSEFVNHLGKEAKKQWYKTHPEKAAATRPLLGRPKLKGV